MSSSDKSFLSEQINEIELLIPLHHKINPAFSKASVGWHLGHMIKVITGIYKALSQSDPTAYRPDFNIRRKLIFMAGFFPRGRARAPKSMRPPDIILTDDLLQQLDKACNHLRNFDALHKNQFFNHYIFGVLNKEKAKRFIVIHTKHHLSIIRDIIKGN
jgi:hypothetical protein